MGRIRSFDRIAATYDSTRGGEERGRQYAADIHPLMTRDTTTLEIGIGTGVVAKAMAELGRTVVGIDIAPLMLAHARDRIGRRVAVANAERLPIRDDSVDAAYSVWVFHLIDPLTVLRQAARVLQPGARFVICPAPVPEPDPIIAITTPMYEALLASSSRPGDPGVLSETALAAGFRHAETLIGTTQTFMGSPAAEADRIENQDGSAFWDLDDQRWQEIVMPAVRALRGLPNASAEFERAVRPPILVLER